MYLHRLHVFTCISHWCHSQMKADTYLSYMYLCIRVIYMADINTSRGAHRDISMYYDGTWPNLH